MSAVYAQHRWERKSCLSHAELSPSSRGPRGRGGAGLVVHALCPAHYDARRSPPPVCCVDWQLILGAVGVWHTYPSYRDHLPGPLAEPPPRDPDGTW